MKRPMIGSLARRSTLHYQTFPVRPPTSRGRPPSSSPISSGDLSPNRYESRSSEGHHYESPLPKTQLIILAIIALAEQTALNSISPYLPEMASTFPEVETAEVGLYVGIIASSFALAQFATNYFWGCLSDRIGRKPVILIGTLLTAACFVAFGFCRTLWQAILVQVLMGLVNGNQGVVSTCLGEITDRSNQSKAFLYLPVIYGLGSITGPMVGGLLVSRGTSTKSPAAYPYLPPNLLSAGLLLTDMVLTMLFLEESLEEAKDLPPLGERVVNLFTWLWQFTSSARPTYLRGFDHADEQSDSIDANPEETSEIALPALLPRGAGELKSSHVLNRDTVLLLITYLIFQLSNISYNSLYPIFASSPPPTGRSLSPEEIGLSLSFSGAITILFQLGVFSRLRERLGNKTTYTLGFGGFTMAFLLMPWVGYKDSPALPSISQGKVLLWFEIGAVLLVKTIAAVGGLTSALLLITNSAPNHSTLGAINGLAQTLSAAGRAAGPFLSGALFSLSTRVQPKGEALAFGVFGGIAFLGLCLSCGIRSPELEAEGWDEEEGDIAEEEETNHEGSSHETDTLLTPHDDNGRPRDEGK